MSNAELIARLRESQSYEWQDPIWETRLAAADRIEALEAKLTKAVGLLGKSLVKEKRDLSSTLYEEISDFIEEIAEIKGESHD
jgi:Skp family chaperone for outer membrane proteins